jgi:hypothetical protein
MPYMRNTPWTAVDDGVGALTESHESTERRELGSERDGIEIVVVLPAEPVLVQPAASEVVEVGEISSRTIG